MSQSLDPLNNYSSPDYPDNTFGANAQKTRIVAEDLGFEYVEEVETDVRPPENTIILEGNGTLIAKENWPFESLRLIYVDDYEAQLPEDLRFRNEELEMEENLDLHAEALEYDNIVFEKEVTNIVEAEMYTWLAALKDVNAVIEPLKPSNIQ